MRRAGIVTLLLIGIVAAAPAALAQEPIDCGTYRGVVCQGFFTDEPPIASDHQRIESQVARVNAEQEAPFALVVVTDSRGSDPADFAVDLANAWGVGDPVDEDGVLVLVSLEERRVEVAAQDNATVDGNAVAAAAAPFFQAEDWDGGLLAIVVTVEQSLAGDLEEDSWSFPSFGGIPLALAVLIPIVAIGGFLIVSAVRRQRREQREKTRKERERLIDADLAALEPVGSDLPRYTDYAVAAPAAGDVPTGTALAELHRISMDRPTDAEALRALWHQGLIDVIDRERLLAETREPLDLRASQERQLLEDAVQQAADDALAVELDDPESFRVKRQAVQRIVDSLRPHRVAAARRRTADALVADLFSTDIGHVVATRLGIEMAEAGPVLDPQAELAASTAHYRAVAEEAKTKAGRLEELYDKLPESAARPAVAAALADLSTNVDTAVEAYETLRRRLDREGSVLVRDGLDPAGIAALLLMNNNEGNVEEFLGGYRDHRSRGFQPAEAVEYAMAGLLSRGEVDRVRSEAKRLDLPVAITAALLNRRDDGAEVYEALRDELIQHVDSDTARTVAGVLAISLEPAQAMRRWLEARDALHRLGLEGSYADVAAAFGASDPRGPIEFALAYAAQRRALEGSTINDADRFAPELAHAGTSGQTDTWGESRIPPSISSFDPFTFFFYHWIVTRGATDLFGWEPIYADASWSGNVGSWWGGGGGFGSAGGGSWGGSHGGGSWGGGSWGGGSFGGFGGGGGFSSSGGGGW